MSGMKALSGNNFRKEAVSRPYAVRTTNAKSGHPRRVQTRRIVREPLSANRARSRSENLWAGSPPPDRIAAREEQIDGGFKPEARRH